MAATTRSVIPSPAPSCWFFISGGDAEGATTSYIFTLTSQSGGDVAEAAAREDERPREQAEVHRRDSVPEDMRADEAGDEAEHQLLERVVDEEDRDANEGDLARALEDLEPAP